MARKQSALLTPNEPSALVGLQPVVASPEVGETGTSGTRIGASTWSGLPVLAFDLLAVLAIAGFFCFWNLGSAQTFAAGDQTTHALVVQEMVRSGDWLHPQYDGRPYYSKPPFKMWLSAAAVSALGQTKFAYRVIDGLSGVIICLAVFGFSARLFRSRLVGYFSLLSLLSCHLFFFFHGVRNGVQDGMMLALMTLGAIIGWRMIALASAVEPIDRRKLWRLALLGGLIVGLAVLTKNVPGYMAFVICASYCLLSGESVKVFTRAWPQIMTALAMSLAVPAAYIIAQGEKMRAAWQMLVVTEVVKRTATGYHNVHNDDFYWDLIKDSNLTVPFTLLVAGVAFALWQIIRGRDRRYLFLLCWAVIPVVIQSLARSKLEWYILPALPGMAMIVGAVVGSAAAVTLATAARWYVFGERRPIRLGVPLAFLLFSCFLLARNTLPIVEAVVAPEEENEMDQIAKDLVAFQDSTGQKLRIAAFKPPRFALHEIFFTRTVSPEGWKELAGANLERALAGGEVDLLLTTHSALDEILPQRAIESYARIPARYRRREWLVILSYVPGLMPRMFRPVTQEIDLGGEGLPALHGFREREVFHGLTIRASSGPKSSVILRADPLITRFGVQARVKIASTIANEIGPLGVAVYLNEARVAQLDEVRTGFNEREFSIPGEHWQLSGAADNVLTFVYELPRGITLQAQPSVAMFDHLTLKLDQSAQPK